MHRCLISGRVLSACLLDFPLFYKYSQLHTHKHTFPVPLMSFPWRALEVGKVKLLAATTAFISGLKRLFPGPIYAASTQCVLLLSKNKGSSAVGNLADSVAFICD